MLGTIIGQKPKEARKFQVSTCTTKKGGRETWNKGKISFFVDVGVVARHSHKRVKGE